MATADDEMRAAMQHALESSTRVAAVQDKHVAEANAAAAVAAAVDSDGEWETVGKRCSGGGVVTQIISRSRFNFFFKRVSLFVHFMGQHSPRAHLFGVNGDFCSPTGFSFINFASVCAFCVHSFAKGARGACSFSPFWFLAVDFAPDPARDSSRPLQATQGRASAVPLEELLAMSFRKNAVDTGEVSVSHVLQQLPKVRILLSCVSVDFFPLKYGFD